ncbi:MAG: hypothetical protein LBI29_03530, partial [Rickettsiales bacterium]|nr:hypothetical protein [Rickettsiales bacterium]
MDNEFFKRGTFGNRVSGSDVFDIELSETEPEGPRITEVEEEGAGQPSEGKVSIVEPDGTIIKKKGNFDPSGRLVIGQKASTGPGGKYNGSKFEGGAFDSNENLIEGSRTEVTVDDREIREEGKFCVSGYLYRGKRTAVGSTGKITESFDFESPGDGVEDTSIDGAKITTEPNGTKTVENGKFDLPSGSLSEGERIKMKIDGLE